MRNAVGTRVLSIVGPGRSGTTVLGNVLAEMDGIASAGELRWLWLRGLVEQRPCGCGSAIADCPVWSRVLRDVLGPPPYLHGGDPVGPLREVLAAQAEVQRLTRRLGGLRHATHGDAVPAALSRLREVTAALCTGYSAATGAGVVVDTSKRAQDAAVLTSAPGIDHYVLHIVRDPRAVAWSWGRAKPLPLGARDGVMATRTPVSSAARWARNCLEAGALRRLVPADRWFGTRYEDFVADPAATVAAVAAFVGVEAPTPFLDRDTVLLGTHHTVAGNPARFRRGQTRIALDDEWRCRMSWRDRRSVEAVTLPLLVRYGYTGGGRAGQRRASLRTSE